MVVAFLALYLKEAMSISHKYGLKRLRWWNRDRVVMRGWPMKPNTKHLLQRITRQMLLGCAILVSGQTPIVLERNGGCYKR